MSLTTYTLIKNREDGEEEVVAKHLTVGRALQFAIEYCGQWLATIMRTDYERHRSFELCRQSIATLAVESILVVVVPRTADLVADMVAANTMIEAEFMRRPEIVWSGRVEAEENPHPTPH